MSKVSDRLRRMRYKARRDYFTLNNLVIGVALVLCASWMWASITTMSRNWELEKRLEARQLELTKLKLEIANTELLQEYHKTAEYLELVARAKQGKMSEGESLVILPDNSEGAKYKYTDTAVAAAKEPSNFESWMGFLFPRS